MGAHLGIGVAGRACRALHRVRHVAQGVFFYDPDSRDTIAAQLEQHARSQPEQVFLRYETRTYGYGEANARINRHAHAYHALGVGKGDVVALVLENRPEFLWHFFALLKLGAIASVINTHLPPAAALHAIRICQPKHVTLGSEVWPRLGGIAAEIASLAQGMHVDLDDGASAHDAMVRWATWRPSADSANPVAGDTVTLSDPAAYIYTSGTTGMPKAAIVRHDRLYRAGRLWAALAFRFGPGDVCYNCLPLYHSNSLLLATCSVITAGIGMALARRFSRTHFWDDIRDSQATAFIYIGEMCRYLMSAAPSPRDREHGVRVISGNGLRPDLWPAFQRRFGIDRVAEFYGATEGNCITVNAGKVVGSCGLQLPGMALARWDAEAQDFERDAHGFLVRARVQEPGLLLCQIRADRRFDGYTDRDASERKIVRDAFERGDAWFNTGDLLRRDALYRLFFVDRLGDTFRWKGENVAVCEVEAVLTAYPAVEQATVYGVHVPGTEGRAGMATLVLREAGELDPVALHRHVCEQLPPYAQPMFVRIAGELSTTSTWKIRKAELQREGFDPAAVPDPLWFLDRPASRYVPLTPALHGAISAGEVSL